MAVAFNAVGAGVAPDTAGTDPRTRSWSHTASGSDRYVIVCASISRNGSGTTSTITRSATYGGIAMTELAAGSNGNGSISSHQVTWGLVNPPTGAQTVQVTADAGTNACGLSGNSISFTGVDQSNPVDAAQMTWGTSTSTGMAQGVTGAGVNDMICQAFTSADASGSGITSYVGGTQRFSINSASWSKAIVAGTAPGTGGTVNFTAVRDAGVFWRAHAIVLNEAVAPPANTGAFFALF